MKTFIAALLCLIMVISLFSCSNDSITEDQEHSDIASNDTGTIPDASDDQTISTASANYDSVLEIYRLIVEKFPVVNQNPRAFAYELGILDENEEERFVSLYSSIHLFYPGRGQEDSVSPHHKLGCGYSVKDLNGDGVDELILLNSEYYIMAIFSYADGKPVLLGNYWSRNSCWIDGDGLLHNNGSGGADYSTNAVYKIANGGKSLELIAEFGTNGHEWINDLAYTKYYKVVDGEEVSITESECTALAEQYGKYFGSVSGAEATKQYSGLTFTSLYTEAEIAMEMYEAVLKNEIKVYETDIEEYNYLKDCKTPYNRIPLCESENLGYVYMDVDGDSINELVIDCSDTLVLRYYEGTVYVYPFTFRNMYQLNTDGSYNWNYNGQNFEYGEDQLAFDGAELKTKELWRIVNDGEPNAEYYIGSKQVNQEEILKYFEDNQKTPIEFTSFKAPWQKTISLGKALEIAGEYWYECYNIRTGDKDSETGYPYAILPKYSNNANYKIALAWLVEGSHYSTLEIIEIDSVTGEIIAPTYEPDGKG